MVSTTFRRIQNRLTRFNKFIIDNAKAFLLVLLILDLGYSFLQHYNTNFGGDFARIVLPAPDYEKVMNNPFGLPVILEDEEYPATNRFFAHFTMSKYFHHVPGFLQHFMTPVSSVYFASAIAKTAIQLLFIWLIATYSTGKTHVMSKQWLSAAVLISPLFQTFGYNGLMGIIDHSITYAWFYALSLAWIGLFFMPFYLRSKNGKKISKVQLFLLVLFSFVVSFNGPLNPAVVLIVCPSLILIKFGNKFLSTAKESLKNRIPEAVSKLHKPTALLFTFISLVSFYSFYIGTFNSEDAWHSLKLADRYALLPQGFLKQFTNKPGPALLLVLLFINSIIVYFKGSAKFKRNYFTVLKWGGLMALVYIILLPLGGYREYRPYIIRRDTIMPVLLFIFFLYGYATTYIVGQSEFRLKPLYMIFLIACLFNYLNFDKPNFEDNDCEKNALKTIAQTPGEVVRLENDCSVMSWEAINNPENSSTNAAMMKELNITDSLKLYYHK